MKTKTVEALVKVLNAHAGNPRCAISDELDAFTTYAIGEGIVNWYINGGYTVPDAEAPVVPVMSAQTVELIVAALNTNRDFSLGRNCEVLRGVRDGMGHDGFIAMVNDYACESLVKEPEAPTPGPTVPVVSDSVNRTIEAVVKVLNAACKDTDLSTLLNALSVHATISGIGGLSRSHRLCDPVRSPTLTANASTTNMTPLT
jgi:hypothetical protein